MTTTITITTTTTTIVTASATITTTTTSTITLRLQPQPQPPSSSTPHYAPPLHLVPTLAQKVYHPPRIMIFTIHKNHTTKQWQTFKDTSWLVHMKDRT